MEIVPTTRSLSHCHVQFTNRYHVFLSLRRKETSFPQFDVLGVSTALLLVATFGVIVRRDFLDWLHAYRYQAIALSLVTSIIAYYTGIWEIYIAAALTLIIKGFFIPWVLTYTTRRLKLEIKTETNPYVSLRMSVLISAGLVALSYFLVERMQISAGAAVVAYLPVSISLFLIGLFVMVSRRVALNQVLGLLISENGLFLFTTALTPGTSHNRDGDIRRHFGRGYHLCNAVDQNESNL